MKISDQIKLMQLQLQADVDNPRLEAELLLAFILGQDRTYLYAHPEQSLDEDQLASLSSCLQRRLKGEPLAYITGHKEFWSLDLKVKQGVLIPRADTELLVEIALQLFPHDPINVAELGTGSGAISIAMASERPHWQIYATDVSNIALEVAKQNAQKFGFKRISFHQGNWFTALPCENFDLVVTNPPYIAGSEWSEYQGGLAYEPLEALVSGKDGLDAIREIAHQAGRYLKAGGYLLIEHGFAQGEAVRNILTEYGFQQVKSQCDLAGKERVTFACAPKK